MSLNAEACADMNAFLSVCLLSVYFVFSMDILSKNNTIPPSLTASCYRGIPRREAQVSAHVEVVQTFFFFIEPVPNQKQAEAEEEACSCKLPCLH